MSESTIQLTAGDGSVTLHSQQRTIGSTAKQVQLMQGAPGYLDTYTAIGRGIRANTANSHLMVLQADGTNFVHVTRVTVRQANIAAAASTMDIRVLRTTTVGSGGSTLLPRPFDASATNPYGGTVAFLPTSKGTEGPELLSIRLPLTNANPITRDYMYEWQASQESGQQAIVIPQATSSGIAVKNVGTASEVDVELQFHVTPDSMR